MVPLSSRLLELNNKFIVSYNKCELFLNMSNIANQFIVLCTEQAHNIHISYWIHLRVHFLCTFSRLRHLICATLDIVFYIHKYLHNNL